MRIGIDASLASLAGSGSGRYASLLIRHLLALDRDDEYVLYFRSRDRGRNPLLGITGPRVSTRVTDAPLTLLRLHLNLPARLVRDRVDLYHSPGFFLPWLWRGRSIVSIHDLHPILLRSHWGAPGTRTADWALRAHIPLALRAARRVLVPSEYTKGTLIERFGVAPERVAVTPLGVDPFFAEPATGAEMDAAIRRVGSGPFFLYVGGLARHKNLTGLVRAFARLREDARARDVRLVVVGRPAGHYVDREVIPLVRRLGLEGSVAFTGYVDDATLRAFYRSALALVLPSFGEGFGLPLLEAMACGTPVVTSPVTAMPEVAGDAALYADPGDPEDIARALARLLAEPDLRRDLAARGAARASGFSWARAARLVLEAYRQC